MSPIVIQLEKAQSLAMANRPKVGGFPFLAEVLRQAGVRLNRWFLPSCQSIYVFKDGTVIQQGKPLVMGTVEVPKFNLDSLISAIRADQEGLSSFKEFLQSSWNAGVISYDVDFVNRKVSYYGTNSECYIEEYPPAEIN
jgi:uncharacterized protein YbcV (DUF1398 family)